MVKIARDAAERLLLMCLYFKGREYNCLGILEDSLRLKQPFKNSIVLRNVYNNGLEGGGPWTQWTEFCTHLQDQLVNGSNRAHHPTLIDIVVDLLQAPYARNVVSGRNLQSLRRAILLPEEMIKFGESIRKEMGCAGCGKTFAKGEMASFHHEAEGDGGGAAFYCTRCVVPTLAACHSGDGHCEGAGELDSKHLTKTLHNRNCGDHAPPKTGDPMKEDEERMRRDLEAVAAQQPQWAEVGQAPIPPPPLDQGGGENPFIQAFRGGVAGAQPVAGANVAIPPGFRAVRGRDGRVELRRIDAGPGVDVGGGVRMPPWRVQERDR